MTHIFEITPHTPLLIDEINYFITKNPLVKMENIKKMCFTFFDIFVKNVKIEEAQNFMYEWRIINGENVILISDKFSGDIYVQLDNGKIYHFRKFREIEEVGEKMEKQKLQLLRDFGFDIPSEWMVKKIPDYSQYYVSYLVGNDEQYLRYRLLECDFRDGEFSGMRLGMEWKCGNYYDFFSHEKAAYDSSYLSKMDPSQYYLYFDGNYVAKRQKDSHQIPISEEKMKAKMFDILLKQGLYGLSDTMSPKNSKNKCRGICCCDFFEMEVN